MAGAFGERRFPSSKVNMRVSPSGKAVASQATIRRFESVHPLYTDPCLDLRRFRPLEVLGLKGVADW
jgi:hypothetical protein